MLRLIGIDIVHQYEILGRKGQTPGAVCPRLGAHMKTLGASHLVCVENLKQRARAYTNERNFPKPRM